MAALTAGATTDRPDGAPAPGTREFTVPLPILLVEDKDSLRRMLRHALEAHDHLVIEAADVAEALVHLRAGRPALVLTDLKLPDGDGFDVLRAAREVDPELPVVVMTAYGSIQDAVTAMKDGATDFLTKPVDPDDLVLIVGRSLARRRVVVEHLLHRQEEAERRGAPRIIGGDTRLRQVAAQLQRAAETGATVLIEGESGTGKELFARALHALSPRADGPFVAINCAAIPDALLESELFGYERGAFTGATARKPGRFELANRGTLFLDEIGELPLALQAKILRALDQKRFERVGGTQSLQVDVRVVAATNRNLRQRVAQRHFREDLFFRLSVFPIEIPPLRERTDDVLLLARHFCDRFGREAGRGPVRLADDAIDALQAYGWPGNVRELQNCIERAVILCEDGDIHARHLQISVRQAPAAPAADPWAQIDLTGTLPEALRRVTGEVERRKIAEAVAESGGDIARAADMLHVSYKALVQRLKTA